MIYNINPATRPATSRPLAVLVPSLIAELPDGVVVELAAVELAAPVTAAPERPVAAVGTALVATEPKDVDIALPVALEAPAMDDAPATEDAPATVDDPVVAPVDEFAVGEVALTTATSFCALIKYCSNVLLAFALTEKTIPA